MDLAINAHTTAVLASVGAPVLPPPRQLDASVWPTCALCSRDVNACRCDPDEASAALYQKLTGRNL